MRVLPFSSLVFPERLRTILLLPWGEVNAYMTIPLWRAEAVEAVGMIRPLRVAEIRRAAGERVGLHRLPIKEIRAGFHHHRLPAGPVKIKSKLV